MKVLFKSHVINVWKPWEIKEVKPWYAMNMLFPKWLAIEFTPEVEKKYNDEIKKKETRRRELIENRHKLHEILNWQKLDFTLKSWANHKVYWAIWEKDIISQIKNKYKIELTKKHIDMPNWHIKKLGESVIFINLGFDAIAKVFIILKEE
jgi:ribosomal protein L9